MKCYTDLGSDADMSLKMFCRNMAEKVVFLKMRKMEKTKAMMTMMKTLKITKKYHLKTYRQNVTIRSYQQNITTIRTKSYR